MAEGPRKKARNVQHGEMRRLEESMGAAFLAWRYLLGWNGGSAFEVPEGGPDSGLSIVPEKMPQQMFLTVGGIQNQEPQETGQDVPVLSCAVREEPGRMPDFLFRVPFYPPSS